MSLLTKIKGLAVITSAGLVASWFAAQAKKDVELGEEAKKEIKAKAPERYAKMCE